MMGLFFEDASLQSKAQKILTIIFFIFALSSVLNSIFLQWDWLLTISVYGILLLIILFIYFDLKREKKIESEDIES